MLLRAFALFSSIACFGLPAISAPAAASAVSPSPASKPAEESNYLRLGFDRLSSFTFSPPAADPAKPDAPPPSAADQIPEKVKQLDGKKAVITGFMLPVKTDKGLVTECLVMKDPMMCCYGVVPQMNEWVVVRMNSGIQALQDIPLAFYGKLHVKELYDNGFLSGIYLLEGEKMEPVK